jgi:hypothetical protein
VAWEQEVPVAPLAEEALPQSEAEAVKPAAGVPEEAPQPEPEAQTVWQLEPEAAGRWPPAKPASTRC